MCTVVGQGRSRCAPRPSSLLQHVTHAPVDDYVCIFSVLSDHALHIVCGDTAADPVPIHHGTYDRLGPASDLHTWQLTSYIVVS